MFLDDFITRAPTQLHRAEFSAMRERSHWIRRNGIPCVFTENRISI